MTAICNGTDLSALVGYGYIAEQVPQYGQTVTALDGTDHTAKIRDRWHLTVPFLWLTKAQLKTVLQLFPDTNAYVSWTFYDEKQGVDRTISFKYGGRKAALKVHYRNGVEYWELPNVELWER